MLKIFVILHYFNGTVLLQCNVKLQSRYYELKSQYLSSTGCTYCGRVHRKRKM